MISDTNEKLLGGFQVINETSGGADAADGVPEYEDYFGFQETVKWHLPDGKQWIAFKPLNEGERAQYEKKTQKEISVDRKTDRANITVDTSNDRHSLILQSVVDWFMMQRVNGEWVKVGFSAGRGGVFEQWLAKANPKLVNELYAAIQNANPWMTTDMTAEAIREEIKRLEDLEAEAIRREARAKNL